MSSFERIVRQHLGDDPTDEEIVQHPTVVAWIQLNARSHYVPERILRLLAIPPLR